MERRQCVPGAVSKVRNGQDNACVYTMVGDQRESRGKENARGLRSTCVCGHWTGEVCLKIQQKTKQNKFGITVQ